VPLSNVITARARGQCVMLLRRMCTPPQWPGGPRSREPAGQGPPPLPTCCPRPSLAVPRCAHPTRSLRSHCSSSPSSLTTPRLLTLLEDHVIRPTPIRGRRVHGLERGIGTTPRPPQHALSRGLILGPCAGCSATAPVEVPVPLLTHLVGAAHASSTCCRH
jgi:hypothetical protein